MQYRKLGKTTMEVSVVCMGCLAIAGDSTRGPQKESDAIDAIHASLDAGVNFFDTAEAYGNGSSEELLAKGLKGRRKEVVIGTKVTPSHLRHDQVISACEASLRRLGTDYIDLYILHWPNPDVPIKETLKAMELLREQGKVRVVGVSNFGVRDLTQLLEHGRAEANQLPYSLLWRATEFEIVPLCVESQVSVTCYTPLMQGLLTGKFATADDVPDGRASTRHFAGTRPQVRHGEQGAEQETFAAIQEVRQICEKINVPMTRVSLAWLLAQPGVASLITGARNAQQARENASAADLNLPSEIIQALTRATDPLKAKLGRNPDLWKSDSRIR